MPWHDSSQPETRAVERASRLTGMGDLGDHHFHVVHAPCGVTCSLAVAALEEDLGRALA